MDKPIDPEVAEAIFGKPIFGPFPAEERRGPERRASSFVRGCMHDMPKPEHPVYVEGTLVSVETFIGPQFHRMLDRAERDPQPGPAGEATPEARLVNVSRWAVAARIRHGVPISELLPHLATLADLEDRLIAER